MLQGLQAKGKIWSSVQEKWAIDKPSPYDWTLVKRKGWDEEKEESQRQMTSDGVKTKKL